MSVFVENSKCGGVLVDDMVPQTVYQRFLCFCNEGLKKRHSQRHLCVVFPFLTSAMAATTIQVIELKVTS